MARQSREALATRNAMRSRRLISIVALLLMAGSLAAVTLDRAVFPGVDHKPDHCPICNWASSLSSSIVPALVLPIELTARCWIAQELASLFSAASPLRAFAARAPPSRPRQE